MKRLSDLYGLTGTFLPTGRRSAPSGWLMCYGQTISRTTYSDLFNALCEAIGTFTVTIAAPGVFTLNTHGLNVGDAVYLTTTGALPTGLTANTIYFVSTGLTTNTFNLSTSRANAYAGTKITTTGSQSGTHTLRWCPYGLGDGSTTFTLPDFRGRGIAGADSMGGTAASRLTLSKSQGSYGNPGAAGGAQDHVIVTAEMAAHRHLLLAAESIVAATLTNANQIAYVRNTSSDFSYGLDNGGSSINATVGRSSSIGSDAAHNNVQPTQVANVMVKT